MAAQRLGRRSETATTRNKRIPGKNGRADRTSRIGRTKVERRRRHRRKIGARMACRRRHRHKIGARMAYHRRRHRKIGALARRRRRRRCSKIGAVKEASKIGAGKKDLTEEEEVDVIEKRRMDGKKAGKTSLGATTGTRMGAARKRKRSTFGKWTRTTIRMPVMIRQMMLGVTLAVRKRTAMLPEMAKLTLQRRPEEKDLARKSRPTTIGVIGEVRRAVPMRQEICRMQLRSPGPLHLDRKLSLVHLLGL
mmetsp:Transcript_17632/g.33281  ORF Transcript_17632/g.33281 Transcript_17632/m.33281 type:complete len:250 (-) Transcript_17632:273-1022(-)